MNTPTNETMTLYNYLKDEFMLTGSLLKVEFTEYTNYHGGKYTLSNESRVEDISKVDIENLQEYYFQPRFLSFGDYDHSCHVERSNKRVFMEEYGELEGIKETSGGFGFEAVLIRLDTNIEPYIETLEALESYPVINEEDCSFLEMDLLEECWQEWSKDEVQDLIDKNNLSFAPRDVRDFIERRQNIGIIESGGVAWIDAEKIFNEYVNHINS